VAVIGSIALLISTLLILVTFNAWVFLPAMIVSGIAGAFIGGVPGTLVGDVLKGKGGQVIALLQMSGDFGAVVAPILLGVIADAFGYRPAFALTAIFMAVIVVVAFRIPETRNTVHNKNLNAVTDL